MNRIPVKNLAHLKKLMTLGCCFRMIDHSFHKDSIGLVREVTTVQTNAVYSKIKDQPDHEYSLTNHGMGLRTDFEKASQYIFGDTVKLKDKRNPDAILYEFEVLGRMRGHI